MRPDVPHPALDAFHGLLAHAHAVGATRLFALPDEPPALRLADGTIDRLDRDPIDDDWLQAVCAAVVGDGALLEGPFGELTRWYAVPGAPASARCAISRVGGRLSLVAAQVPTVVPTPERLMLPPAVLDAARSGVGLVVFAGLSGSGKTTTAFSVIEHFNAHVPCHICTVEDPVEVRFEPKRALVQQRQVGLDVPDTVTGIRAALRQDLDALFVSRVDRVEVLQACLTAAAGGHLVLMQLEASSVDEAIRRMADSYPDDLRDAGRRNLAQVLTAVCVQRLLPRQQGDARRGRVAAYAFRVFDDAARAAVAAGRDPMATEAEPGHRVTMAEALEGLRADGHIDAGTLERALRVDRGRI